MRMLPRIFGNSFFDDFMDQPLESYFPVIRTSDIKKRPIAMKTDLWEKDGNYELSMELPGVKKENVSVELDEGYLSISASAGSEFEEKDSNRSYIKRERYRGEYKRSFFVGDNISSEDIKAKFEDGVLLVTFPKKDPNEISGSKVINIE